MLLQIFDIGIHGGDRKRSDGRVLEKGRTRGTSAAQACIAPSRIEENNVVVVVVVLQGVIRAYDNPSRASY